MMQPFQYPFIPVPVNVKGKIFGIEFLNYVLIIRIFEVITAPAFDLPVEKQPVRVVDSSAYEI
jgi:hypothetical protein